MAHCETLVERARAISTSHMIKFINFYFIINKSDISENILKIFA